MKTLKRFLICILIPFSLDAMTLSQRVDSSLFSLEEKLGAGSMKAKAESLLRQDARKEVFALQSYGRLFQDHFKYFKKMREDFKVFEDAIGQAAKWEDLLQETGLSVNDKKKYLTNLETETNKVAKLLDKWEKEKKLKFYKKNVDEIDLNDSQSDDLSIESIKFEIKNTKNKKFDFTYGETGLHELRRSVRWIALDFELFKDLFTINKTNCGNSVNNLYELGLQSKSNVLVENTNSIIEVDYCSYLKVLGSVKLLGTIKDDLEQQDILNDKLPLNLKKKTESIYKEIIPLALKDLI